MLEYLNFEILLKLAERTGVKHASVPLLQRLEPATPRQNSNAAPTRSGAARCASPRSGFATATQIASTAPMKTAPSCPTATSRRRSAARTSSSARTEDASTR